MHQEALKVLPELIKTLNISRPLLFGPSEGGTIAANTPEQFAAAYKAELAQYEKIIKAAGLKVQ